MKISIELHNKKKSTMEALRRDRLPWWTSWRDIADYYLPKRYVWLMSDLERSRYLSKNGNILDATGTTAGRVLAAGMMNGITSPSRPWFKIRLKNYKDDLDNASRRWLDEVERRMLLVMGESNAYNCLAVMYLDLVFFGTASMLVYEDYKTVIRCYNNALGEYYLGQDSRHQVNTFAREFTYKVHQVVERWGIENVSERVKLAFQAGNARMQEDVQITCLVQPNIKKDKLIPAKFEFCEIYYETAGEVGTILEAVGYNEMPGVFPRWELTGNDSYGTGPGHDALGDVIQLQHETKRKGQSLDYMVRPPMVMDIQLQHRPTALLPGGQTFVAGLNNAGAKPAYQINPPIGELTLDIKDIQARIKEIFHNQLFNRVMTLDTVRSAAEIAKIDNEQLVLIGPVMQRFQNEGLDPFINRTYNIMSRSNLLPEPPPNLQDAELEIQYVSMLNFAQSAVGVIPTERFLGLIGNVMGIYPDAVNIPNWDDLLLDYARDIGVKANGVNGKDIIAQLKAEQDQAQAMEKAAAMAPPVADAAKQLSETQVGGGSDALSLMMGA